LRNGKSPLLIAREANIKHRKLATIGVLETGKALNRKRNPNPRTENEMNMKFITGALLAAMLLPSLAMAQTNTRATFGVTKVFGDGNDEAEVAIAIDCNTGIILDQDKLLSNNEYVEFVVTDFTEGTLNCFIVEGEVTDGYSATYSGDGINGDCEWEAIEDGDAYTCEILNEPDSVKIEVTKVWEVVGDNNDVSLEYSLRARCNNVYNPENVEMQAGGNGYYKKIGYDNGEGPGSEVHNFYVRPGYPSSNCYVNERVYDSAIEIDNGCGSLTVSAGVGATCTITNTVFFEGIPTLSQYGMAIMALLMLGVGFVGFRRFA
jgi:hypothetical protein